MTDITDVASNFFFFFSLRIFSLSLAARLIPKRWHRRGREREREKETTKYFVPLCAIYTSSLGKCHLMNLFLQTPAAWHWHRRLRVGAKELDQL